MALVLTGVAPSFSQTGKIVVPIPNGRLTFEIQGITRITESIANGTLILNASAPTVRQNTGAVIPIGSTTLSLTAVTPFVYDKTIIDSGVLTLTGIAPSWQIKSATVGPPNAVMTLIGYAPTFNQQLKQVYPIAPGQLRLVSYRPISPKDRIPTGGAGGGPRARPGHTVIIDGQRRVVTSQGELDRLIDLFIRKKEAELRQVENHEPQNKKKIKVLKTKITKAHNRKITEAQKWKQKQDQIRKQIEQENEEILLLLTG